MKNSNKINLIALAVLIALANYMCGCSVVGLGVGAAIDSRRPDYRMIESEQAQSIDTGTNVTIHHKDGSLRKGKFTDHTSEESKEAPVHDNDTTLSLNEGMLIIHFPFSTGTIQKIECIPLHSISHIEITNVKETKHLGLITGLIIDILLVWWISSLDISIDAM